MTVEKFLFANKFEKHRTILLFTVSGIQNTAIHNHQIFCFTNNILQYYFHIVSIYMCIILKEPICRCFSESIVSI